MSTDESLQKEFYDSVESVLKEYIPHQFIKDAEEKRKNVKVERKDIVQFYINNSNNKLRMYGSADDLENNLKLFWSFPLRNKWFPSDYSFQNKAIIYTCINGKKLYCKQDFVSGLFDGIRSTYKTSGVEVPLILSNFLKYHEEKLNDCFEFAHNTGDMSSELSAIAGRHNNLSFFQSLIAKHSTIFLPNREIKDKKATAVVRIFDDVEKMFVMEAELFNAINFKNPEKKALRCKDKNGYWKVIDAEDVQINYKHQIAEVDFLSIPIVRTQHAAVFIPTPSGDHCTLANDAFFENLRRLFFGLNVFQKVKSDTWHMVTKYISILEKYFPPDMKYMYFISRSQIKKLEAETDEFWKPLDQKPVKAVRDVGPKGFTPEDVRKELKYLGITDLLPEVASHAEQVFDELFGEKFKNLKTVQMFLALERCQLMWFVKTFDTFHPFIHYQSSCDLSPNVTCKTYCQEKKEGKKEPKKCSNHELPPEVNEIITKLTKTTVGCGIVKATISTNSSSAKTSIEQFFGEKTQIISNEQMESVLKAMDGGKKEKEELQKKCYGLEMRVKETQEEMKKLKKQSSEINEKRKEEIQKLKNEEKKDEGMEEIRKVLQEKIKILEETKSEMRGLEENLKTLKMEKEKIHVAHSKMINKKEEELEKLSKEKNVLEEKAKKTDDLEKQLKEIQKEMTKKNEEVEKLKKANLKSIKGKEEEIEKIKKHQAEEIKEKKKEVDHLKVDNLQQKNQQKELRKSIKEGKEAEKQLKEENRKLSDKVRTLEKNLARLEKSAGNDQLKMAIRLTELETEVTEKEKFIKELQKSSQNEISGKEKANEELQSKISQIFHYKDQLIGLLSTLTPSESPSRATPCLPTSSEFPTSGYTLQDLQEMRDTFDMDSLLREALEMKEKIVSLSNQLESHQMAYNSYKEYEEALGSYQRAIEMNIQLLETPESTGFAIPIPELPTLSEQFIAEYWALVDEQATYEENWEATYGSDDWNFSNL